MKTQAQKISVGLWAMVAFAFMMAGCASGSSSSSGSSTSAESTSSLEISAASSSILPNTTDALTVSGGVAPYTASAVSLLSGTLVAQSSTVWNYTASSLTGTVQINVVDSAGSSSFVIITVSTTGGGGGTGLTVSPTSVTIAPYGTQTFTASGGSGFYSFYILGCTQSSVPSQCGSFSGDYFTAPSLTGTVTAEVYDTDGNYVELTITVSNGSGAGGTSCEGTYNMDNNGTQSIMTIVENPSTGAIAGSIVANGSHTYQNITGTCTDSSGVITFKNSYTGNTYSGTYFVNSYDMSQIVMDGTFLHSGKTYNWTAFTK